jgi:predicted double-glycine peptidase
MLLDLPDVRQREDFDCGTAAVETVLRFLGVRAAGRGVLADQVDGTHPSTIEAALRRAGLAVQSGTMTPADLRHHTRQGRPVLCPIAAHGGHWVVVRGVGRGFVYYSCPAEGAKQVRLSAWLDLWRDSTRAAHDFDRWGIAVGKNSSLI